MNKPQVTIIVPTYNRGSVVLETLQSIKIQNFNNWECIIVDDYSKDETVRQIKEFIVSDARYKFIQKKKERKGAPSSRNIGWKMASSKLIVFLDSDDLLAPWALEKRVAFMKHNSDLDFALFSNIEFEKGFNKFLNLRVKFYEEDLLKSFLSFESTWQTSSPIWKKSFLKKINGWDEDASSWQDGEIHIRALLQQPKFLWNDSILPDYFIRLEGAEKISKTVNISKRKNNLQIYKKIYNQLPKKYKPIFKLNVQSIVYNRIENLDVESSLKFINVPDLDIFELSDKRLKFYIKLYHKTKSIPVIRKLVYLIREKTEIFGKRKVFFQKATLDEKNIDLLRNQLQNIDLYTKNFQF